MSVLCVGASEGEYAQSGTAEEEAVGAGGRGAAAEGCGECGGERAGSRAAGGGGGEGAGEDE